MSVRVTCRTGSKALRSPHDEADDELLSWPPYTLSHIAPDSHYSWSNGFPLALSYLHQWINFCRTSVRSCNTGKVICLK